MRAPTIFSKEVADYIRKNENTDPYALALKKSPFPDVNMKVIARQIQGRKIAKRKFPFLLAYDQYQYPKKESLEQASSEKTALYKSKLISGDSFVDLTGGMGIDTYLLGRNFGSSTYIEPNESLYQKTVQNFLALEFHQCETIETTCEAFLKSNTNHYDWAYVDPSRRIGGSRKTSIHNYEPNVVELKSQLLNLADNVLIKLSPMQDVSECVKVLEHVQRIWVVGVRNEVKELLLHLKKEKNLSPHIFAIDLQEEGKLEYSYPFVDRAAALELGNVQDYIYQPNPSIVKAELHDKLAEDLNLIKLHPNTNLYTSQEKIEDFMGRVFFVRDKLNLNKKYIKKVLPEKKANIITKNFPINASELARKYGIKGGGENYLICYKAMSGENMIVLCDRIK